MLTRSRALALRACSVGLAGLAVACGGQPTAGPSPIAVATPPATVAAIVPALPLGVDPDYVRMLARLDPAGRPQRWEGGPFHHCFGVSLAPYRGQLEAVADRLSSVSGIPRTTAGPCTVEWVEDPQEPMPATAYTSGTATGIFKAVVRIQRPGDLFGARPAAVLHEGGHILGLRHSDRAADLMNPDVVGDRDFSRDELAVLAWMYGR